MTTRPIVLGAGTAMLSGARVTPAGQKPTPSVASRIKRNGRLSKPPIRASMDIPPQEELTLQDAVFLLAIARHTEAENLSYLKPYHTYTDGPGPLA